MKIQPPEPESQVLLEAGVTPEVLISGLLRIGVLLSLALILLGMILTFIGHPDYFRPLSQGGISPGHFGTVPHRLKQVWQGLRMGHGPSVVMAGVLALVSTPVLRVALSIAVFLQQRDRTFVIITMLVLGLLLTSFVIGKVAM